MDYSKLVDEIARRVAAKLEDGGRAKPAEEPQQGAGEGKPRLLVLTQGHGAPCHEVLTSMNLLEYYHTECALTQDYQADPKDFEAIILFQLDCDALARLAGGVCDTPYTRLARRALLLGRKIFVPEEEIELLKYRDTAPAAYYQARLAQLTLLQQAGVTVCPAGHLEQAILSGETRPSAAAGETAAPAAPAVSGGAQEITLSKHIVTERDLRQAKEDGVRTVRVSARAIITDLARDYARDREMTLVRG